VDDEAVDRIVLVDDETAGQFGDRRSTGKRYLDECTSDHS